MNKTELARKIKELNGLSKEDKSALLELLHSQKKYGLVWEDKPEEAEQKMLDHLPVLKEISDRAIISDNPDAPNHILIEGDNLEALTALSYTHAGKIDVIYIDPPYNTGNKDFVYNDAYVDTDDTYRHSKWLSFINKRLVIAKKLLSETGVIFISIDENEIAQLKLLCDEIFTGNFLQQFIVESNPRGSQSSKYFATTHEYILCYSKKRNPDISFGLGKSEANLAEYSLEDEHGKYRLLGLRQRGGAWRRSDRPLLFYPFYINPANGEVSLTNDSEHSIEVIPCRPSGEESRWTWSKEKVLKERHLLTGVLVNKGTANEKWDIARKNYLIDESGEERKSKVKSIWNEKEINYQNGGTELKTILGKELFSYPKPLFLLSKVLGCSTSSSSTILDFFAGSGTTLNATMQLNAEDGGHRTCILCQGIEKDDEGIDKRICENVTYERNKRVINGYTKPNGEQVAGLTDNNLRYYRTELLPGDRTIKNMKGLVRAATGLLCIKNDLYTEASFAGRKFNPNHARYFEHGDKRLLVIYNEQAIPFIVHIIKTMPEGEEIKVYVFAYGSDPYEADFAEVKERVTLCALPDAIYNAYKKVLPKRKPQFSPDDIVEEIIEEEAETAPEGTLDFNNGYEQEGGDQ